MSALERLEQRWAEKPDFKAGQDVEWTDAGGAAHRATVKTRSKVRARTTRPIPARTRRTACGIRAQPAPRQGKVHHRAGGRCNQAG
jgi:hypothetical protein